MTSPSQHQPVQQWPPTVGIPPQRQAPPAPPRKPRTGWKVTVGVIAGLIVGLAIGGNTSRPVASTAGTAGSSAPSASVAAPAPALAPASTVVPAPVSAAVPAPAPEPAAPVGPLTSFSDGTYEVGADIAPGKYKTPGPGSTDILDSCYMEVGDGSGSISGIDQNDNLTGPGVVTLKKGKVFKVRGDCTWTKVG